MVKQPSFTRRIAENWAMLSTARHPAPPREDTDFMSIVSS